MAFELPKLQIEKRKGFIIKIFLIFAISLFVLWAGYGFSTAPILKDAMRVEEKLGIAQVIAAKILPFWKEGLSDYLERFLLNAPFPLGEHLLGILGVIRHGYEGHRTFFLGKWSSHGNPLYFIVAFLIKTPIPTIIFLFTSLLFIIDLLISNL